MDREHWMPLLARAPIALLEAALGEHSFRTPRWLRPPETGLMMVPDQASGIGGRFPQGEVTVTRCALRLPADSVHGATVGVAYVLGRSHRHAQLAAIADALLQDPSRRYPLEVNLLAPVRDRLAASGTQGETRIPTARVEFFRVERETDAEAPQCASEAV